MPRCQPARIREIRLHRRKKTATCSTYRAHGKVKPRKVSDISPLSRIDAEPRWIFGAVSPTAVTDDDPAATDAERRAVAAAAVTAPADTINPRSRSRGRGRHRHHRTDPKILTADTSTIVVTMGCGDTCPTSPESPTATGNSTTPRTRHRRGPPHPRPDRSPHPRPAHRTRTRSPMTPAVAPHARINHRDIRPGHRPTFDAQRTGNRERRSADSRTWPQRPTERVPERTVLPQPVPSCTG